MKRTLLLLFTLLTLGVSGTWASTYFVAGRSASITTGKQYMIYNTARRYFLSANGAGYAITGNTTPLAYTTTDANYIWTLETGSSTGYKIKNVGTSTYAAGGTSLGSAVDYVIDEFSTCPNKGGMPSYNDDGTTTAAASITSSDKTVYIVQNGTTGYWNGTESAFNTYTAAHVYVLYEVVEIADGGLYTIDFVSQDGTKTWGLTTSGTSASAPLNTTGSTFVAHAYTNAAGNSRWIFVNNTDGYFLAYQAATANFDTNNAINEWNIASMTSISSNNITGGDRTGLMYITNDKRYTDNASNGCYILKESNAAFDNSVSPFWNGTFTSALAITPVAGDVSSAASLSIAKFDALYEVKDYVSYAGNISALFDDPSSIITNINAAETASAAATIATNFMKSPEGKKFFAVNSTATGQYMNIGTSQITATSTKLYAEAVMELEYAGNSKYYLKGVKSGYYAGNPNSGSANPGTYDSKGSATALYVGNAGSTDNQVYFAREKSGTTEAIQYNSRYTEQGYVVAWSYNAGASQWNITYVPDDNYTALCNVCDVTYNVIFEASGTTKATSSTTSEVIGSTLTTPGDAERDFTSYTFYSDAACTSPLTTVPDAASTTIYALAAANTPFTVSADYATATWYNMKLHNVTYPLYTSGADPNVSLPTEPGTEANMEWAFIGNPYDGYQIINKGAGDGLVLGSETDDAGTDGSGSYATMATSGTQTYERWFPRVSTHYTNGFYLYNSNGHALNKRSNDNLAYWTGGADQGSTFTISSVTDNAAELTEIANRLDDYTYGSEYGEYSLTGDYSGFESLMAGSIIPGLKSSYSYTQLLNAQAIEAAKSLNVPQAGDFLRIKASATNKSAYSVSDDIYLTSSNTQSEVNNSAYKDNRVGFVLGTANDNTTIFYYDGDSHLTGLANGLQPTNNSNQMKIGTVGASATIVTFESIEGTENKAFRVEFNDGGRSLHTQRYSGVYFTDAAGGNATGEHYRYFLERVTSLPVTITSAGWATLYSPVALTIPDGITAYIVTANNTTTLHLEEISTTIPANTGVLLSGEAGSYNFDITTGGSADGNLLTGTCATISRTANSYVLGNGDKGVAFYGDGPETLSGFKAYFQGASGVKAYTFDFETAVRAIEAAQHPERVIYDLSGRRVENPSNGIYIVNGKKVIIK